MHIAPKTRDGLESSFIEFLFAHGLLPSYAFPRDLVALQIQEPSGGGGFRVVEQAQQGMSVALCDALTIAISRVLDVDAREVSAGFRFGNDGTCEFADIFIYDTLTGGAGYALEASKDFKYVFEEAMAILGGCSCSTSCENCLRHYGNRFHHADLDRFLGLDLAHYILEGLVPAAFDAAQQRVVLTPLMDMIKLAGWEVSDAGSGIRARHQGQTFELFACPSLRECISRDRAGGAQRLTFTPYELARDLPSAFAELK